MTDNRIIFDTVRPWLDSNGFNVPARVEALNGACDRFRANPSNSIIFEEVRPWLDRRQFTPERIAALNAACATLKGFAAVEDGAAAGASAGGVAGVISTPAPAQGDDRYLAVFQRLASPQAKPETVKAMARAFAAHAPAYGQDRTKPRIAEFVAQISNETGGFVAFSENLRYSARRLMQVWPGRFPTLASALPYAWDPSDPDREDEALAERTYGGRGGNERDGTGDGDGWRYRGRGALQLTFYDNYKRFGEILGLPLAEQPDMASDPAVSVLIALEFYKQGNVNRYIDAGNFKAARGITNAGNPNFPNPHGLENVTRLRLQAMQVLG